MNSVAEPINLHTHTFLCKHASGSVKDYVANAKEKSGAILGFSDHTPLPDGRWSNVRMSMDQIQGYMDDIDRAAESSDGLLIIGGLECEYAKEYVSFYKEEILAYKTIRYLVAGIHYYKRSGSWYNAYGDITTMKDLGAYTDFILAAIDSDIYAFIAHPDLFANCYLEWDEQAVSCSKAILEAASEKKIPLEINGYGFRKPQITTQQGTRFMYPLDNFWQLAAEYDIRVICNSDAHNPLDVYESIDRSRAVAQMYNLKEIDCRELVAGF
jgi:histidinol-phosphatase (PHP family)